MNNSNVIRSNAIADLIQATLSDGSKVYDIAINGGTIINCTDHQQASTFMLALDKMSELRLRTGRIQLEQRFCNRCDRKTHHHKHGTASWICGDCSAHFA